MIPAITIEDWKECPRITHDMLINRIPFTAVNVPDGCLVLRILAPLEYIENDRRTLPSPPGNTKNILTINGRSQRCDQCNFVTMSN